VESELGRGSTFTILWPRASPAALPAPVQVAARGSHGTETLLLVEDNEQVALLTATVLRRRGYKVLLACDGLQALAIGEKQQNLELLVTDLGLPGMGGHEVAVHLRAMIPGLKILFMSGNADSDERSSGEQFAGEPLLEKPFTPDMLAERVREVLDG
jgi:CheY-like chemotaxis protein